MSTEARERDCPRAKSRWTPCVFRDGEICVVEGFRGARICVGCEKPADAILAARTLEVDDGR